MLFDYSPMQFCLQGSELEDWLNPLLPKFSQLLKTSNHGKLPLWHTSLKQLPTIEDVTANLNDGVILKSTNYTSEQQSLLRDALEGLHPWRKGPFTFFDTEIDTEWRSDWKWDRLKNHIDPLDNRTVLDVGCGSGYHCWRMAGANAKLVIGLEPMLVYNMQYWAIQQYLNDPRVWVLPLRMEDVPTNLKAFDSIFSMGVLYHRRSPFDHLIELKEALRPGGQLILETLVIDGDDQAVLVPEGRYARMNNVWFLPGVPLLESWLRKLKFKDIQCIDVTETTVQEQRTTPWMTYESLTDNLDHNRSGYTIEGHPAPKRAILIART
jgi:tRNA (mo5U34)-methyltransferase